MQFYRRVVRIQALYFAYLILYLDKEVKLEKYQSLDVQIFASSD